MLYGPLFVCNDRILASFIRTSGEIEFLTLYKLDMKQTTERTLQRASNTWWWLEMVAGKLSYALILISYHHRLHFKEERNVVASLAIRQTHVHRDNGPVMRGDNDVNQSNYSRVYE